MPFPPNTVIGNYELLELLGVGGMGEVYRARHTDLHRLVAFKVLKDSASDEGAVLRFRREIDIHVKLVHPNLVRLIDGGCQNRINYLVMEILEGSSLDARPRGKPMPLLDFMRLARPLISALQFVHERGIVHRDLKPSNLLMTKEGILKVSDFGLAQAADTTILTQQGQAVGTPAYMPPEVLMGSAWSPPGDMFSVGIIFYELLTEALPFRRDLGLVDYIEQVEKVPPPPIGEKRKTGRPELDQMVISLLSPDAAQRPTAGAVAEVLERVESGRSRPSRPITARIPVITPPPMSTQTQRPGLLGLAAAALLLPVAALGWMVARPAEEELPPVVTPVTPSAPAKPSPDAAVFRKLDAQIELIDDLEGELNKMKRGGIDDAMGGLKSDRAWQQQKKKVFWEARSLVHTAVEEGVSGPVWLKIEGALTSIFKLLDRQNFYGGLGKDHELDILFTKLDPEAEDPYRRVASLVLATFIQRGAKITDASRQEAYLESIRILEDLAREPGNDLTDHFYLMRMLVMYSDLMGIDIEVRSLLKSGGTTNKGVLTSRHRMLDVALEALPKVDEWSKTDRFDRERFCIQAGQEAKEVIEKLAREDDELGRKALRVLDGYHGLLRKGSAGNRRSFEARIDWTKVVELAKKLRFTPEHLDLARLAGPK